MKSFRNNFRFSLFLSILCSGLIFAGTEILPLFHPINNCTNSPSSIAPTSTLQVDHSPWDRLLKKYVSKKRFVNYKGFKQDGAALDNYLKYLSNNEPNKSWSRQAVLAYYINLYNAATIKLILEHYPVKSIKDISRPWSKKRISVGKQEVSLDEIEHDILRKMEDPRIHFALNCASISCPKLSDTAYTPDKIDEQLERATKDFLNSEKNDISPSHPKISSIFNWYKKDFKVNGETDVIGFINQYSQVKIEVDAKISFLKYDWNLNGE